MEIVHKAALYAVLTFVIVGAAISLAGPGSVSAETTTSEASNKPDRSAADRELLATQSGDWVVKAGT